MSLEKSKRIKEIRGLILSDTSEVESYLTLSIINYFSKNNQKLRVMIYKHFLEKAPFIRKIELLKEIPEFKKLKKSKKILTNLDEVRITRNKIAHATAKEIKGKKTRVIFVDLIDKTKNLEVDDNYIKKFEDKTIYLINNLKI